MSKLRIMSNNIWSCGDNSPHWLAKGLDCSDEHRIPGFIRVYSETQPDILGLQECSARLADSLMQNIKKANMPYALLWGRDTPILYRTDKFELIDSDYLIYPEEIPGLDGEFNNVKTKSYCIAVLRTKEEGKLIIFASTHLWWMSSDPNAPRNEYYPHSDEARTYQINLLLDKVDLFIKKYNCPAVVVGDFNAVYSSEAIQSALKRGWNHAYNIATDYRNETDGWHYCYADGYDMYENPRDFSKSIDHALIANEPTGFVRRFERYAPEYYMPLSDHFPMWIDVDL